MERSELEAKTRTECRRIAQERGLGGTWTPHATKADFVASILAGKRMLGGVEVDPKGARLDGADAGPNGDAEPGIDAAGIAAAIEAQLAKLQPKGGLERGDVAAIAEEVAERVVADAGLGAVSIVVPGRPEPVKLDGAQHAAFADVVEAASVLGVALVQGPAGSGKTTLARQVATALGRPFHFLSCTGGLSEAQLMGRVLIDGSFQSTPLLDAIETGGVCLLDEADALDPNVTLALNAGISSGVYSVPNRAEAPTATAHPDFVLIVAGNDFSGGSMLYTGRAQQDAALLDRFAGAVFTIETDKRLTKAIAKAYGKDAAWLAPLVEKLSANVARHRVRRVVSPRAVVAMGKLIAANPDRWAKDRAAVVARMLAGWTAEETAKVLEGIDCDSL